MAKVTMIGMAQSYYSEERIYTYKEFLAKNFAVFHIHPSFSTIFILLKYSFGHLSFFYFFDGRETRRQVRQEFHLLRNT